MSFHALDVTSRYSDSFDIAYEDKNPSLCECVHCGSAFVTYYGFTDYDRDKDELVTKVTDCGSMALDADGSVFTVWSRADVSCGDGLRIYSALSSECLNPSERNQGFVIKFWCKDCHRISLLELAQVDERTAWAWAKITLTPKKNKRKTIKPKLRFDILERDNHTCQACGATPQDGATLEIDHIKPIARGGTDDPLNLQVLCRECNSGKGAR